MFWPSNKIEGKQGNLWAHFQPPKKYKSFGYLFSYAIYWGMYHNTRIIVSINCNTTDRPLPVTTWLFLCLIYVSYWSQLTLRLIQKWIKTKLSGITMSAVPMPVRTSQHASATDRISSCTTDIQRESVWLMSNHIFQSLRLILNLMRLFDSRLEWDFIVSSIEAPL